MTRAEHLAWAKERALQYLDSGDTVGAWGSLVSDLGKHPGTAGHGGLLLGHQLLLAGHLDTPARMREHIRGFN